MSKAIATTTGGGVSFSRDQVDLIKRTIAPGATDDELQLFVQQCERTGLDPFARQIYAIKRWDAQAKREVMAVQTSIDGFRLIADRTGNYAGQTAPQWCGADGQWRDVWLDPKPPAAARVGVLRKGWPEPCYAVARFDAYAGRKKGGELTAMWARMPDVMIAKCAEGLALRKAFPQELSGIYTGDEMEQADAPAAPRQAPRNVTPPAAEAPPLDAGKRTRMLLRLDELLEAMGADKKQRDARAAAAEKLSDADLAAYLQKAENVAAQQAAADDVETGGEFDDSAEQAELEGMTQ